MSIRLAVSAATTILLVVVAVGIVDAQLAPVASHDSARARPAADAEVVARVNGAPIRGGDVEAAMNSLVPMTDYHRGMKPDKLDALRSRALDGLIDEELRYQEALRLKIQVPPADVDAALARAKKSYATTEEFERARRVSGATMPQLRAGILRGLLVQRVYEQAIGSRCRVTEADAATFYRENPARFVMPEQLHLSVITIGVDPASPPKEWERARRKAADVAQQIAGGASFDALARQHSTDESRLKGGDLGFVHRGQLVDEFERALRDLTPGHVSPVVQTIFGFHLLRLVEARPAAQKSLADVKATIVRDLTDQRCSAATADWSKALRQRARIVIVGSNGTGRAAPPAVVR